MTRELVVRGTGYYEATTLSLAQADAGARVLRSADAEKRVDGLRGVASFGDRPHDERRAAVGVACAVDAFDVRRELAIDDDVLAGIERDAELFDERVGLGADEAEREDQRVDGEAELGAGDIDELAVLQLDAHAVQRDQLAVLAFEARGAEREVALAAFFLRARRAEHERPRRPRVRRGALGGRRGHQLDLHHVRGALAMRGTEAVAAGVAAAEDDHALAFDVEPRGLAFAAHDLVLLGEVVHREDHAVELAAGDDELAR